jgi:hypothetical protein
VQKKRIQMKYNNAKVLLVINHHNFRESSISTQLLIDNNIDCLCIPAHSSTVLQPLDLTINGTFKQTLAAHFETKPNVKADERRVQLLAIAGLCLQSTLTILNITKGFAKAGIFPFSIDAPLNSSLVKDLTSYMFAERPSKKARGVSISGKVLTDGTVFAPIVLPSSQNVISITETACTSSTTDGPTITSLE